MYPIRRREQTHADISAINRWTQNSLIGAWTCAAHGGHSAGLDLCRKSLTLGL